LIAAPDQRSPAQLLAEAWWDGTGLVRRAVDDWAARNRGLAALVGQAGATSAVAGNLAWQASAFNASTNLRRANLFARLSWQHEQMAAGAGRCCSRRPTAVAS